ncbi:Isoquinoline 1-oxidoreductase subunit beta [Magnetospirillum sp. LM-5]|uniref:xanthine dehydrogenase family protein molybdopterin-binding subunit n=1 Tax=Magnetospirillum sp. LM-5 TaxID=2681466 RepID=UPI00137CE017|nr:xanthine dehydrogenase family protein molybdopterin-binding subunit [Magnetospirillum sp. LM-5]CAA7617809.1 Isoquinoline 1-oxidoreductase subunit beta [Magnetospirillum sp. LM-5]
MDRQLPLSRRSFLLTVGAAGAGLTLGFKAQAADPAQPPSSPFQAYLRISPDSTVTILSAHMDMGQGIYSGIALLVAEELDLDPAAIAVEGAWGNPKLYGNLAWGGVAQGTGGSTAMKSSFQRYRMAGAAARAMLVEAASQAWRVSPHLVRVEHGMVIGPKGRKASIGAFAEAAAAQPVPAEPHLKSPTEWRLIGKEGFRRLDSAAKSTGRQTYTADLRLPGMLTAVLARPPLFGATVKSFDATAAKAIPGVVEVAATSRGVAVIATDTWTAIKGRQALTVEWDQTHAETRGSAQLWAEYRRLAGESTPAPIAASRGNPDQALKRAVARIDATYEFPYLAHAAMEPLNAVAARTGDMIEVWGGHQMPDLYRALAAKAAGVAPESVRLHVMMTGGGFGRRAVADGDVVVEAVECAKAIGWRAPVKVQWTREDDMTGGRYRPMMLHKVAAGIGLDGQPLGWRHRIVGQSIGAGTPFEKMLVHDGVDHTSVEGVSDSPYAPADFHCDLISPKVGVPVLWWRSVGLTHTAFVTETLIDEMAVLAGKDPLAYRRALLADHPRHLAVLDLVAAKAGWGDKLPPGRFRGLAVHQSFGSVVAQVAEIALDGKGGFKVIRVVCAVDCGLAVQPDQIRAQMEGGIGFGLGAALYGRITLTDGRVDQTSFNGYEVLRLDEMPVIEVHIVPSAAPPTGVGEPGVPPIAPAIANALAAATGKRTRTLPFKD